MKHLLNLIIIYSLTVVPVYSANETVTKAQQNAAAFQQFVANFQQQMQQQQARLACQRRTFENQQKYMLKPLQDENFPQCKVLQARGNHMYKIHQCRHPDQSKSCDIKSFYEIADQNQNALDNYLGGHTQKKTTGYGDTCLKKAAENMGASYDKVIADLQAHLSNMKEEKKALLHNLKPYLDKIKAFDAVINGEQGENQGKLLKRTDFAKWFGDQACRTVIDKTRANQMGKGGNKSRGGAGLRSIEDMLEGRLNGPGNPPPRKILTEQKNIEKEIRNSVKKIARDLKAKGMLAAAGGNANPTYSDTEYGIGTSASLKGAVDASLEEFKAFLDETQRKASKYTGSNSGYRDLIQTAFRTEVDMQAELESFEKGIKDRCFEKNASGKRRSVYRIIRELEDRKGRISKKKERKSDNLFKNTLHSIMEDSDLTIEEKLRQVLAEEKKNKNWVLRTGKSIPCGDTVITASGATRLSDIMSCYVKDCQQRFNKRRKGSKAYPPKALVKLAQKIHAKVKSMEATFENTIENDLLGRMLHCKGMDTKASGVNSCQGNDMFNTGGARFCLKQAVTCSANINGCMQKTKEKIEQFEKKKFDHAKFYNQEVDKYKANLKARFEQIQKYVDGAAKRIQSVFPAAAWFGDEDYKKSFASKDFVGLNAKFPDANNIDPALMMEDPEKYYELMEQKVAGVIQKIKEHKQKALQDADKQRRSYLVEWQKEKSFWTELRSKCMAAIDGINQQIAQANKAQQEAFAAKQKAIGEFCMMNETFNAFPDCDKLKDLYEEGMKVSAKTGHRDAAYYDQIKAYQRECNTMNNKKTEAEAYTVSMTDIEEFCEDPNTKNSTGCEEFNKCIQLKKEVKKMQSDENSDGETDYTRKKDERDEACNSYKEDYKDKLISKVEKTNKPGLYNPWSDLGQRPISAAACQAPSSEQQPGKFIFNNLQRTLAGQIDSSNIFNE